MHSCRAITFTGLIFRPFPHTGTANQRRLRPSLWPEARVTSGLALSFKEALTQARCPV